MGAIFKAIAQMFVQPLIEFGYCKASEGIQWLAKKWAERKLKKADQTPAANYESTISKPATSAETIQSTEDALNGADSRRDI